MARAAAALALLSLAACAPAPAPHSVPPAPGRTGAVDPGKVRRVRHDLPPGYEVAPVANISAPEAIWRLGDAPSAVPAPCAALADPGAGHGDAPQGFSASGPGGTVYAVVVPVPPGTRPPDGSVLEQCHSWTMTGGRSHARVRLVGAPRIAAVPTLGMTAELSTSVEGGSEIDSQATTFVAYLSGYTAFTTLVVDPGAPHPPLPAQFAADLLVKTVSAVQG